MTEGTHCSGTHCSGTLVPGVKRVCVCVCCKYGGDVLSDHFVNKLCEIETDCAEDYYVRRFSAFVSTQFLHL